MSEFLRESASPSAHRLSTASKQHRNEDLQPWTAARCQRLLRQLQSRITCLRKLVSEAQKTASGNSSKRPNPQDEPKPIRKRTRYTYAQRRRTSSNTTTHETLATTPPRSVRTFGAMRRTQCSPATGRVDFRTPLLRKIREQPDTPIVCPLPIAHTNTLPQTLASDLQALRRMAPDGHFRIYEAIVAWLNSLLRSTETQVSEVHPKSLLGMCLRKVPETLAEIEAWDRKMSKEAGDSSVWSSSNACLDLYGQLEGFGSTSLGWKPLKIVVRMHAMTILTSAVSEGLFSPDFVYLLADVCVHMRCHEEAAKIVSCSNQKFAVPRSSASMLSELSTTRPLQTITESLCGKNSPGASFDCLTDLIKSRKLPLGWLSARGFRSVWAATLESLTTNKPAPSTMHFMCTALEFLALNDGKERWSSQDGREQTLVSLAAGMSAAVMILGSENKTQTSLKRRRAFRRLLHALEACISRLGSKGRASHDGGFFILALAQYLATVGTKGENSESNPAGIQMPSAKGNSSHVQYRQALILTCSIAKFRGRACGLQCHDILSELCDSIDILGFPDWFREGLRTDGAFVLAQKTQDLRDLAFAESLPAATTDDTRAKTIFSGWRWDEGISEWVMPTPAPKPVKGRRSIGTLNVEKQAENCARPGRGRRQWSRCSEPVQRTVDDSSDTGSGSDTDLDGTDSDDTAASDYSEDELQILEPARPVTRPREPPTSRVPRWKPATATKRDIRGRLVAKDANARIAAGNGRAGDARGPRVKVSTARGLAVSGGPFKSSQGTVVKQLKHVKGASQIHGRGNAVLDDDWDELI